MAYDPRLDPKYKDNKLFLALINQESRFNPNAVSPTGARGLTQVLPSTARDPGFGLTPNTNALTDPKANTDFGFGYFSAMQRRYKGDNAAALVAYNGGPGAADRWVKSGKNDAVISKESRNYYKTILSSVDKDFSKAGPKVKSVVEKEDYEPLSEKVVRKVVEGKTDERLDTGGSNSLTDSSKPVSSDKTSGDDDTDTSKPAVKSTSSDDDDSSSTKTVDDTDSEEAFGKVKRELSLTPFSVPDPAPRIPIRLSMPRPMLLDDPRLR